MAEHRLDQVLRHNLCIGCGACAFVGRDHGVVMLDHPTIGRRPVGAETLPEPLKDQLAAVCPGSIVRSPGDPWPRDRIWEGWAADPQLRWAGSSGGVVTALARYGLERLGMVLVVHTGMDPDEPWRNRTVISRTVAELEQHCGSRYATSSPVEAMDVIERADGPCVFIGKPCDVAAVAELRRQRPRLEHHLGLVLSFFCAGTPPTSATLSLAAALGFEPPAISALRYRGRGWPGRFTVTGADGRVADLGYEESWGSLVRTPRPLRCNLCPDGLGELADVTGGDAWHRRDEGTAGISFILARTDLGARVVADAIRDGYLVARPSSREQVLAAQPLARRRLLVGARVAALRSVGLPAPRFPGFGLARASRELGPRRWVREYLATLKRIWTRGYLRRGGQGGNRG